MIQIKKTILTLVALLALTTHAWAEDTTLFELTSSTGTLTFGSYDVKPCSLKVNKNTEEINGIQMNSSYNLADGKYFTIKPATGSFKAGDKLSIAVCYNNTSDGNAKAAIYAADGATLLYTTANGINGRTSADAPAVEEYVLTQDADLLYIGRDGDVATCVTTLKVVRPAAASGPEVAWTAATKTGKFTMPGGNVTLEPEYYPQATVADGGVTAADADARATTDDPLVKVDATKLTGAKKLMYFVSNSGTAPAYDAEGWTDQLPTAEGITQQGIVYVWYYPVGTDEGVDGATATYSDGDICLQSITARIAPEPTYAVTFAEGTEESDKWKAEPAAGVKKGTEVTVTYSGTKKVIGVKAEKKAAEPVADIVWDVTNVSDLNVESTYVSYTKEGVKLSGNADNVQVKWNNSAYLGTPGMEFIAMESGGFTFTAPTGKKFTKIEMKAIGSSGWATENLGTGWAYNTGTVTWNGSAASTVKLLKDADMFSGDFISSIAFYLSE